MRRVLHRIGPEPSTVDLTATSMWSDQDAVGAGGTDVAAVPAVDGLYVDLTGARARYGLGAPRFALLEAGHVAQNLALVAAAGCSRG